MLILALELMSKCVSMLMVMLMVMLSWVGGGGDGHLFVRRGGHRMRQQTRNLRLLQAGGGSRDEGDSLQQALQQYAD